MLGASLPLHLAHAAQQLFELEEELPQPLHRVLHQEAGDYLPCALRSATLISVSAAAVNGNNKSIDGSRHGWAVA